MFDAPSKLLLGLLTGIAFGFLLQKGGVSKFPVIVGQLLLRDWTVAKIMITAIAVGSLGVYFLVFNGTASLQVKPALLGGVIGGGLLFGIGLAVLGYCPGTTIAACGEGKRDAFAGAAGMLAGALAYVWLYPTLEQTVRAWPDWGNITIPEVTATSPWYFIGTLLAVTVVLAFFLTPAHRIRPPGAS